MSGQITSVFLDANSSGTQSTDQELRTIFKRCETGCSALANKCSMMETFKYCNPWLAEERKAFEEAIRDIGTTLDSFIFRLGTHLLNSGAPIVLTRDCVTEAERIERRCQELTREMKVAFERLGEWSPVSKAGRLQLAAVVTALQLQKRGLDLMFNTFCEACNWKQNRYTPLDSDLPEPSRLDSSQFEKLFKSRRNLKDKLTSLQGPASTDDDHNTTRSFDDCSSTTASSCAGMMTPSEAEIEVGDETTLGPDKDMESILDGLDLKDDHKIIVTVARLVFLWTDCPDFYEYHRRTW